MAMLQEISNNLNDKHDMKYNKATFQDDRSLWIVSTLKHASDKYKNEVKILSAPRALASPKQP